MNEETSNTPPLQFDSNANRLNGPERVATLLLALLPTQRDIVGKMLNAFQANELECISAAAARIGTVGPTTVIDQIKLFLADFRSGPTIIGGAHQGRALVEVAESMQDDVAPEAQTDRSNESVWTTCARIAPSQIAEWMSHEPPAISAYWLSKLPVDLSSKILAAMKPDFAAEIIDTMLQLNLKGDGIDSIVESVVRGYIESVAETNSAAEDSILSIASRMEPAEFEQILQNLAMIRPGAASRIQESLFNFEDFPTLASEYRSIVVERLTPDMLTKALPGADPALVESFLSALGSRTRRMVENELRSSSKIDPAELGNARQKIVAIIVQLIKEGQISKKLDAANS